MLLRLSRVSFWLAAAAAALALLAPVGHETMLTAVTVAASAIAFVLWRSAMHDRRREYALVPTEPGEPVLDQSALADAAAAVVREAHAAASFGGALHAVARVLRSELGARQATVCEVHAVDEDHAFVADLIEAQPEFQSVERLVRLGVTPLGQAVASAREAGSPPGAIVIPVSGDAGVVAAIELTGIELPIDPKALASVLELSRLTLSELAPRHGAVVVPTVAPPPAAPVTLHPIRPIPPINPSLVQRERAVRDAAPSHPLTPGRDLPGRHAQVLVVEDNVVQPEVVARALRRLGCRVTMASGMLEGLHALCKTQFDLVLMDMQMSGWGAAEGLNWLRRNPGGAFGFVSPHDTPVIAVTGPGLPGDGERIRELGFDDHLAKPCRQSELLAMLIKHLRPRAAAESGGSVAPGQALPEPLPVPELADEHPAGLDAGALARLTELDPKGTNHLVERVLRAFQTSVARLRPQADAARANGDRAAVRLVAHTLKSSSASIGALHLSQLCGQIESALRLNADDDIDHLLDQMGHALDLALAAIDKLLKERE